MTGKSEKARKFGGFILLFIFSITIFAITAHADSWNYRIQCIGDWRIKLKQNDLINGSNFEFVNELESEPDEVELTIRTHKVSDPHWEVSVKRGDSNWPDGLKVYVKRTGDRTGIDGGRTYKLVSSTKTDFFTGTLDEAKKIPIQLKVSGLASVMASLNSKNTLETEIVYTLTEVGG